MSATSEAWAAFRRAQRRVGRVSQDAVAGAVARARGIAAKMSDRPGSGLGPLRKTMPGAGPVTALVTRTFAPDLATFKRGRDFAASCDTRAFGVPFGGVPKQHATGGKARLGKTST